MIVVTAGNKYLDIDAYASGIAYAHLLKGLGKDAIFASSARLNGSIAQNIIELGFEIVRDYKFSNNDKFIIEDLSNPQYIDRIVNQENIIEIIDHHTGFEHCWKDKKCKIQIEFIGSVATIIFEKYVENNMLRLLDTNMCKLLISAILDNTLNLKSDITTQRDIKAYQQLQKIGGLTKTFDQEYFISCQSSIDRDVIGAIKEDIKIDKTNNILPTLIGQLTIYNKKNILKQTDEIVKYFSSLNDTWMLNQICLKDGKSYILATDKNVQRNLENMFNQKFNNNILTLPKFKLRKEIIKQAQILEHNL